MSKLSVSLPVLLFTSFLTACGGGGNNPTAENGNPVVIAPTVSAVNPKAGISGVAISTEVKATFSRGVAISSVTPTTFLLTGPTGTVAGTVAYDPAGNIATYKSIANLTSDAVFTATLTSGVTGTDGTSLVSDYSWTFKTAPAAGGAAGSLDTGFGTGGKVVTAHSTYYWSEANAVAVQSDNKIVVVGFATNGTEEDFAVVRYNADGSLDTNFGTNGIATTPFGGGDDAARAVAIQPDGKIVVAGCSNNGTNDDFVVARYTTAGALDTGFGTGGKVTTAIGTGSDCANAVALQIDGKIVAAGYSWTGTTNDFALVRYNSNGTLDTGFDSDGKVTTSFGSSDDAATAVAVQSDGMIVAAGHSMIGGNYDFTLARFTSSGGLDAGFGTGGKAITDIAGGTDYAYALAIQPSDGKIVVAGTAAIGMAQNVALARFTTAGALDAGLDTDGKLTTAVNGIDRAQAVAIQADGSIVAAGYTRIGGADNYLVSRYTTTGLLDPGFGTAGIATKQVGIGITRGAYGAAIQGDGKIVAAGYSSYVVGGGFPEISLLRFDTDGSMDTTFDYDGVVTTAAGKGADIIRGIAVQADGKIVAAGLSQTGASANCITLLRYTTTGGLDTSFDTDGIRDYCNGDSEAYAVGLTDGKIVVAGTAYMNSTYRNDFIIARFMGTDGSGDSSFGFSRTTNFLGPYDTTERPDIARAVAVQADGKIVAVGSTTNGFDNDFAVARYTTAGPLDTTFSNDGKVTADFSSFSNYDDYATAVAIQQDAKIIVAGYSGSGSSNHGVVLRYNSNGSLDTVFDTDGKADIYALDEIYAIAVQWDGKIVLAGVDNNDFKLVRLTAVGAYDSTFGSSGSVTPSFGSGVDVARALAIQPDGKIVAAGYAWNGNNNYYDFVVVRYTSNGLLDITFGSSGKTIVPIGVNDYAYGVAVQPDGGIVVGGRATDDFAVVRLWP